MKEATGEANMTIITVVLIAAVVAIATPLITNAIKGNQNKVNCLNNGCYYKNGKCYYDANYTTEGCSMAKADQTNYGE